LARVVPAPSENEAATFEPSPGVSRELEEKYGAEYRRKVERETERVQDSYGSLFAGLVAVFASVAAMGLFCLWRTRVQAAEIDRLKADAEAQSES
jgi:hypothetical protein